VLKIKKIPRGRCCMQHVAMRMPPITVILDHAALLQSYSPSSLEPANSNWNQPVHRFSENRPVQLVFRFNCMNGLLGEPDQYSLWFGLLPVGPPVRSYWQWPGSATEGPFGWNYKPAENTVGWFFVREKYCSGWKNKPNKTDYKPDEQAWGCV
jgi:hypothetical protein